MNRPCILVALLSSVLALTGGNAARADEPAAKAVEVPVARPVAVEIPNVEDFAGRTEAVSRVDLRARVSGYLLKANFQDGAEVKQGDALFEIDARPYQAEVDKAQAAVSVAEAEYKLAEANHKRALLLETRKAISQEDLNQAVAQRTETEAKLRLANSGLELARLNLSYTKVVAPIGGQIGRRLVDPGNLVRADETSLAVIIAQDPMQVYFNMDERTLLRLRRARSDAQSRPAAIAVAVGLPDEKDFPHRAELDFADNHVDSDTGTLRLRAAVANKEHLLLPGMFVRVRLTLGEPTKALQIPAEAVMTENGQKFVFIVGANDVIEKRPIVLGPGTEPRAVTEGLKAEDRVVIGRLAGLRPGMTVRPREEPKPAPGKPARPNDGAGAAAVPPAPGLGGSGIQVRAAYPGANAQIVSDTVRFPVEQQIAGMENIAFIRSRCTCDGAYALGIAFARGVDLKTAQLDVQNRVTLAMPTLPQAVKIDGVSVRRGAAGVLMIVNVISPDSRYDQLYLSNYASLQIKDELCRVSGVADVALLGHSDFALRIWVDPEKLASRDVTMGEFVRALEEQNMQLAAGPSAGNAAIPANVVGRVAEPEQLENLVVKTTAQGLVVRLRDVARVELGAGPGKGSASLDGKPVVALVIRWTGEIPPRKVLAALEARLTELRKRLPPGLDLDTTFDFTANVEAPERSTTPEYLLADLDMPAGASLDRVNEAQRRCAAILSAIAGIQHVLALSDNPFDPFGGGPCVLVRLSPAEEKKSSRDAVAQEIRTVLARDGEIRMRLRDISGRGRFPRCGYPMDLALSGPELERVAEWAKKLAERMAQSRELTDVWLDPATTPRPQRFVEINRVEAAARGVSAASINDALLMLGGRTRLGEFQHLGRVWRVEVQTEPARRDWATDLPNLKVRNANGQLVPLSALATVRELYGPFALDFLDCSPMIEITANPAAGGSLEIARKLCMTLAEEIRKELGLPAEYRLTWL